MLKEHLRKLVISSLMVMIKRSFLLASFFVSVTLSSQAQTLENIRTSYNGEKVFITYDLNYPEITQKFNLTLYSSYDNYIKPVTGVSGSINGVAPGKGLRIVWDAKSVLPADFDKEVTFRLKAAPALKLTINPLEHAAYRRGKNINVGWAGGSPNDKVNIELVQKNIVYKLLAENEDNDQAFVGKIPKKLKIGKDYIVRLKNAKDTLEVSNSQPFTLKTRIPLLLKALPVVAAGVIILLTRPKDNDDVLPGPPVDP